MTKSARHAKDVPSVLHHCWSTRIGTTAFSRNLTQKHSRQMPLGYDHPSHSQTDLRVVARLSTLPHDTSRFAILVAPNQSSERPRGHAPRYIHYFLPECDCIIALCTGADHSTARSAEHLQDCWLTMARTKPTVIVVATVLVCASAIAVGSWNGRDTAAADITRLQVLWPSVMSFPDRDRAFLAGLAMSCGLHSRPVEHAAIVGCLSTAATDPNVLLPKGEVPSDAPSRLTELLYSAGK